MTRYSIFAGNALLLCFYLLSFHSKGYWRVEGRSDTFARIYRSAQSILDWAGNRNMQHFYSQILIFNQWINTWNSNQDLSRRQKIIGLNFKVTIPFWAQSFLTAQLIWTWTGLDPKVYYWTSRFNPIQVRPVMAGEIWISELRRLKKLKLITYWRLERT
jgi:hypothetical protein